jgi:hypothetical protein
MNIKACILILSLVINLPLYAAEPMTQKEMESIFKGMGTDAEGEGGSVGITFKEVRVFLVSDPIHNRMRLLVPIAKYEDLNKAQVDAAMISNFHLALDARYAVSKGVLYSAFLHPLEELNKKQIQSAVRQVASLAITFGTTFSSGELSFGLEQKKKPVY